MGPVLGEWKTTRLINSGCPKRGARDADILIICGAANNQRVMDNGSGAACRSFAGTLGHPRYTQIVDPPGFSSKKVNGQLIYFRIAGADSSSLILALKLVIVVLGSGLGIVDGAEVDRR